MLQLDYLITRQTLKAPRNTALAFGTYTEAIKDIYKRGEIPLKFVTITEEK